MELNEHTRLILGQPNFRCSEIAEILRHEGRDIPRKSEEEQAYVIHWLLGLYEAHGKDWKTYFTATMSRILRTRLKPVEESSIALLNGAEQQKPRCQHKIRRVKNAEGQYERRCEKCGIEAHSDGDFSYMCGREYCRCMS